MSLGVPVVDPVVNPFTNMGAWKSKTTGPDAPRGALWMCARVGVEIPLDEDRERHGRATDRDRGHAAGGPGMTWITERPLPNCLQNCEVAHGPARRYDFPERRPRGAGCPVVGRERGSRRVDDAEPRDDAGGVDPVLPAGDLTTRAGPGSPPWNGGTPLRTPTIRVGYPGVGDRPA